MIYKIQNLIEEYLPIMVFISFIVMAILNKNWQGVLCKFLTLAFSGMDSG